jgi:hypothetical protein
LYILFNFLNKSLKSAANSLFNATTDYRHCVTDLIEKLNFRNFINQVKPYMTSIEDIFHWDKLRESHDKRYVTRSTWAWLLFLFEFDSRLDKNDSYKLIKITREDLKLGVINKYQVYLKTVVLKNKTLSRVIIRIDDTINMLFSNIVTKCTHYIFDNLKRTFSFGFYYLRGLFFLFFIDACLTDDEPLWEPIEWSLVQTWILFIFSFAWIAENLIVSRYGSFTGRDKRVWMAWYKTFWLIEGFYILNYGAVSIFVIVPFYFETNYNVSFIYSWWHWYSRVFFFQFISFYTVALLMGHLLQINLRWVNWKKGVILIFLINILIAYLIYTHFIIVFFGYFTDPIWYQKTRPVDYIQLSHEPSKWGWGPSKKDHFTYHNVKTVFWFKNDGPFASSFLLFHLFLFLCLFFLFIFWLSLLRRVWSTKEIPITFTTYCVSSLKQFFYFFLFFYVMVFISFLINYMRLPWEYYYFLNTNSWLVNFLEILLNYIEIFFYI